MTSMDEFFGNYLKVENIKGDTDVIIASVGPEELGRGNDKETKLVAYFKGLDKGLVLNKINADKIAEISGSKEIEQWINIPVCLYVDPDVTFGSRKVGGVRVKETKFPSGVGSKEVKIPEVVD